MYPQNGWFNYYIGKNPIKKIHGFGGVNTTVFGNIHIFVNGFFWELTQVVVQVFRCRKTRCLSTVWTQKSHVKFRTRCRCFCCFKARSFMIWENSMYVYEHIHWYIYIYMVQRRPPPPPWMGHGPPPPCGCGAVVGLCLFLMLLTFFGF